jgi:hypothetical protein
VTFVFQMQSCLISIEKLILASRFVLLVFPDLVAVRCASPAHSLCAGSCPFLLILPSAPESSCSLFVLRSTRRNTSKPIRFPFAAGSLRIRSLFDVSLVRVLIRASRSVIPRAT